MAAPTEAEIQTQLKNAIYLLEMARQFGCTTGAPGGTSFVNKVDAFVQSAEGDYAPASIAQATRLRSYLGGAVSQSRARALLTPIIREYGRLKDYSETTPEGILDRLSASLDGDSAAVTKRGFTYGAATAGVSNVGTGTINRLTVDELGYDLDGAHAEVKTFECVGDIYTGATEHNETFRYYGEPREIDDLLVAGSGTADLLSAVSGQNSAALIRNPSFEQFTGTIATPTAITGWTPTADIANYDLDETYYYRSYRGDGGTQRALKIMGNDTISQDLTTLSTTGALVPGVPYYCQLAWNREAYTGVGATITLAVGSNSAAVAVSTTAGWNILRLALNANLFYENFKQSSTKISIACSGLSSGQVLVDDVIFAPMSMIDGTYWSIVGGATKFVAGTDIVPGDVFTATDTSTGAVINYWLWRAFNRTLPSSTGGGVTIAEPLAWA